MLPIQKIMDVYQDKKRKIDYFRIKKMLNLEISNSDRSKTEKHSKIDIPIEAINFLKDNNISNSFKEK